MAEKITKTDLPVDPKERRAALNAMLKPLVDRAVAACAEARQAVLRSDEVGAKLVSAQMEGAIGSSRSRTQPTIGRSSPRGFC